MKFSPDPFTPYTKLCFLCRLWYPITGLCTCSLTFTYFLCQKVYKKDAVVQSPFILKKESGRGRKILVKYIKHWLEGKLPAENEQPECKALLRSVPSEPKGSEGHSTNRRQQGMRKMQWFLLYYFYDVCPPAPVNKVKLIIALYRYISPFPWFPLCSERVGTTFQSNWESTCDSLHFSYAYWIKIEMTLVKILTKEPMQWHYGLYTDIPLRYFCSLCPTILWFLYTAYSIIKT